MYFLRQKLHICTEPLFDNSHRCNNDLQGALRSTGLWSTFLVMMILWSVSYGPFHSAAWWRKVQEHGEEYMAKVDSSDALFQAMLPRIASDSHTYSTLILERAPDLLFISPCIPQRNS